jgi:predicted dehydrogenase
VKTQTYRAGIAGLGMIGGADQVSAEAIGQSVDGMDGTHFAALAGHERVDVVAGSSRDAGRRERFATRSGAAVYEQLPEMLDRERLDILSIATYAPAHEEAALAAVAAGVKVVYCEKPIAQTVAAGRGIAGACERAGALLVVNHQRRFAPGYRRLTAHVAAGRLGSVTSAYVQWGKGRLGNVGTHTIDGLRMVIGQEVEAVSGLLDLSGREDCRGPEFQDPGGWGMLRMAGGTIALLDAPDYGAAPMRFLLNGTEAQATIGPDAVTVDYADGRSDSWPIGEGGLSSMDRAVTEIVAWLDGGGGEVAGSGDDAARTLEVIAALHASHERGSAWVDLPLTGADLDRAIRSG